MKTVAVEPVISDLTRSYCELWDTAEAADPDRGLTRSLTHNLIVVTDERHAGEMRDAIDHQLRRHPCRAFLIVIREEESDLEAELIARTRVQGTSRAMVLERLTLTTSPSQHQKLPNLVRPLLVNDIPATLFWARPLPQSLEWIAVAGAMADRTIVDSTLFLDGDWDRLQALEGPTLDLAWLRMTPWRRSLAESFESFSWTPDRPTRVRIEHSENLGATCAAKTLSSWLTTKLQADVELIPSDPTSETEPTRLDLTHGDTHIEIHRRNDHLQTNVTLTDHCLLPNLALAPDHNRSTLLTTALNFRF